MRLATNSSRHSTLPASILQPQFARRSSSPRSSWSLGASLAAINARNSSSLLAISGASVRSASNAATKLKTSMTWVLGQNMARSCWAEWSTTYQGGGNFMRSYSSSRRSAGSLRLLVSQVLARALLYGSSQGTCSFAIISGTELSIFNSQDARPWPKSSRCLTYSSSRPPSWSSIKPQSKTPLSYPNILDRKIFFWYLTTAKQSWPLRKKRPSKNFQKSLWKTASM